MPTLLVGHSARVSGVTFTNSSRFDRTDESFQTCGCLRQEDSEAGKPKDRAGRIITLRWPWQNLKLLTRADALTNLNPASSAKKNGKRPKYNGVSSLWSTRR
jgi:hypothetical protein